MVRPPALDAAAYSAGDVFMQEKASLFSTAWLPLCAVDQLEAAGSFVSATIGGWPLFAIRGTDAVLRGFRNLCRHQNMLVVEKPEGECEALRCRYHGWTYALDGSFVTAPPLVAPASTDPESTHLIETTVATWSDLVFLRLDNGPAGSPMPPDADETAGIAAGRRALDPGTDRPDPARWEKATIDIGCNWKVAVEELLADDEVPSKPPSYHFPLLFKRSEERGTVLEQIMPRSFLRTRLIAYRSRTAAASESLDALQALKQRLEEAQSARVGGNPARETAAVERFHSAWGEALTRMSPPQARRTG